MEVGCVPLRQLGRRVDPGGLEQVRVLPADAVDADQVGMVHPLQDQPFADAGLLGQRLPPGGAAAVLEQVVDRRQTVRLKRGRVRRADPLDLVQIHACLLVGDERILSNGASP